MKKILLAITDIKGKSILFILNNLEALTREQIIQKIKIKEIAGYGLIKRDAETYIKALPNIRKDDNINNISISLAVIFGFSKKINTESSRQYFQSREDFLIEQEKNGESVIYIDNKRKITEKEAIAHISKFKEIIISAASYSKIDPNTLGAVLIDEYARLDYFDMFDWAAILGFGNSVGVAQVKTKTARDLIRGGYYNPNPRDKNLLKENILKTPARYLYQYVRNPTHSVYFAAAKIKQIIDIWLTYIDLSNRPEILGTLYSMGKYKKPHPSPLPSDRGKQIKDEFYKIAQKALNQ